MAGKAVEILIDNDSPKAFWLQEQRLLNSNGTPLGYLRPSDRQSNSGVPMNFISFAIELTWCKRKRLYFFQNSMSLCQSLSNCWPTRYLTHSLYSLVRYRVGHSKRNSMSPRAHVLFFFFFLISSSTETKFSYLKLFHTFVV